MTTAAHDEPASGSSTNRGGRPEKPLPLTLRELRHQAEMNLASAADPIGLNAARLSEIERGVRGPSAHELQRLAYFYGPLEVAIVVREASA